MRQKILVFGNILVEEDRIPLKILPKLRKIFPEIDFIESDPTENLENYGENLRIIDTALEINQIKTLKITSEKDFEKLKTEKICSMHDFDLGYNLKLLKKMRLVDEIEIICLPMNITEEEALAQLQSILRK